MKKYKAKVYFDGTTENYNRWVEGELINTPTNNKYIRTENNKIYKIVPETIYEIKTEKEE